MTDEIVKGLGESIPAGLPESLRNHGLLVKTATGLYGWGAELEAVYSGLANALTEEAADTAPAVLNFPPVLPRAVFEKSEYVASFPQLFGAIHAFQGDEYAHEDLERAVTKGEDWGGHTQLTDFVLAPAVCYSVYPLFGGTVLDTQRTVDATGYCFRHEPSTEPGRLVSFRLREFVKVGGPHDADAWFRRWKERSSSFARRLGLDVQVEAASDPFFGTTGQVMAENQREEGMKAEVVVPIGDTPVAVASINCHRDHFGRIFDIRTANGEPAHSACVGFGLERLAFALVAAHGPRTAKWPAGVRELLWGV
jgi:seryl-tRNA synthetase